MKILIDGVEFTEAAIANLEEVGFDPASDVAALRRGDIDRDQLLDLCLAGADEDRRQGWEDYVDAVSAAAARGVA